MPSFHKEKENPLQGEIDQKTSVVEDLKRDIQKLLAQQKTLQSDIATLANAKIQAKANADKIIADATSSAKAMADNAQKKTNEAKSKEQEVLALADANKANIAKDMDAIKAVQDRAEAKLESIKKHEENVASRDLKLKMFEQALIIRENKCLGESEKLDKMAVELDSREKELELNIEAVKSDRKEIEKQLSDLQMLRAQYDVDVRAIQGDKEKLLQDKKDLVSRETAINESVKYVDNKRNELHELDIESNRLLIESKNAISQAQVAKQDAQFTITSIQNHKDELKRLIEEYNKKTEVK